MDRLQDFKRHFKHYQNMLGLTGYEIFFEYEELDGYFANITWNLKDMVATVTLNKKVRKDDKKTARHEALHLLLARLEGNAGRRYATEVEISESSEEICNKLTQLIP